MNSVLLDTSFFIRLLNHQDQLHENARAYYKFFLEEGIEMIISTISISNYAVNELYISLLYFVLSDTDLARFQIW